MSRLPLLFLSTLLLLPLVAAQAYIEPVPAFVGLTVGSQSYSSPPGSFSSQVNFTWKLSPTDPDQINGTFNYTIYLNDSSSTGWSCLRGCLNSSGVHLPVPNHPGWVYIVADTTTPLPGGLGPQVHTNCDENPCPGGFSGTTFAFNITANWGTVASAPSCKLVNLSQVIQYSQAQCGSPQIEPPQGLAMVPVYKPNNATVLVSARWPLSVNDTNQTIGDMNYTLFYAYTLQGSPTNNGTFQDTVGSEDGGGFRVMNLTWGLGGTVGLQYQIQAMDTLTHQKSNLTCPASVNLANINQTNGCGSLSTYDFVVGTTTGATFPGADLPAIAVLAGVSLETIGWIVGTSIIFVGLIAGYIYAKGTGAIVFSTAGLAWNVLTNLYPPWFMILIFFLSIVIIVLTFNRRG